MMCSPQDYWAPLLAWRPVISSEEEFGTWSEPPVPQVHLQHLERGPLAQFHLSLQDSQASSRAPLAPGKTLCLSCSWLLPIHSVSDTIRGNACVSPTTSSGLVQVLWLLKPFNDGHYIMGWQLLLQRSN